MCSIHNIHGIETSKDMSNAQAVHDMLEQQNHWCTESMSIYGVYMGAGFPKKLGLGKLKTLQWFSSCEPWAKLCAICNHYIATCSNYLSKSWLPKLQKMQHFWPWNGFRNNLLACTLCPLLHAACLVVVAKTTANYVQVTYCWVTSIETLT